MALHRANAQFHQCRIYLWDAAQLVSEHDSRNRLRLMKPGRGAVQFVEAVVVRPATRAVGVHAGRNGYEGEDSP